MQTHRVTRLAFLFSSLLLARCALVSPADDVSIAAGGGSHHGGTTGNTGGTMSGDSGVGGAHNNGDGGITAGTHTGGAGNHGGSGGNAGTSSNAGASGNDGGIGIDAGTDAGMSGDPCDVNNGGCDPLVTCDSSSGTVACGNCPSGYDDTHGDGTACAPVDCGVLTAPTGGSVDTTSGTTYNQTATYSCNNGYAMVGGATRKCLSNGSWNGSTPTCVDIDECLGNPCDADGDSASTCSEDPTPGNGYSCTCTTGYEATAGLAPTCSDFNACDGTQVCTADYPCQDFPAPSLDYTCRGQYEDWTPSDSPSTFTTSTVGGDDIVTDSGSSLVWQRTLDAGTYNWVDAKAYCAGLSYANHSDWRLPTRAELESIIDFNLVNPSIDPANFPGTSAGGFWSSSPVVGTAGSAWLVGFGVGDLLIYATGTAVPVRCVRSSGSVIASAGAGGAPPSRYTTDAVNGTVLDTLTGLTWQRTAPTTPAGCTSGANCTQSEADTYCSGLTLASNSNWRLPTISELRTLVDPTQNSPTIDPTAFPSAPAQSFWSSTTYVAAAGNGWIVDFSDGSTTGRSNASLYGVRCVR